MFVKGVSWLGVKTDRFGQTAAFFRQVLGLTAILERPDFVIFRTPDGDLVELFGPAGPDSPGQFSAKRVAGGFLVGDIEAARARLQSYGVELVGPLERHEPSGLAWQMFRGPDGLLFELMADASRS